MLKKKLTLFLARYVSLSFKHSRLFLLVICFLAAIALVFGTKIKLKSDLKELLPSNSSSVESLNKMIKKVGGMGLLIVAVEGPNERASKKFLEDLAGKLKEYPSGVIRSVNYKVDDIEEFYNKYALYYLPERDLRVLRYRIQRKIEYEKLKMMPVFLDLMEDDEDSEPISEEISRFKKKVESKLKYPLSTVDGYYGGEWGNLFVMLIRPYGESLGVEGSKSLIANVKSTVASLNPASYDPQLEVGYCGNVVSTVEEYFTLRDDIFKTALLCLLLVGGVIILYFLRIRAVIFLGATLFVSLCFTSALVYLTIGYLNAQTAFLGTIIIGTGINYGVILFARYLEERKRGLMPRGAMVRAVIESITPTFLAAATTAVSFAVLAVARIRGLSQFGFIGSTGVIICWLTTMLFLPPLVLYSERWQQLVKKRTGMPKRKSAVMDGVSKLAAKSPWFILGGAVVGIMIFAVIVVHYAPRAIEYDFTKMRNQTSVVSGTEALERRVSRLFRSSMTPAVAVVNKPQDSKLLCEAVNDVKKHLNPADVRLGSCKSIYDLLPPKKGIDRKINEIRKIKNLLHGNWRNNIAKSSELKIQELESRLITRPPNIDDLPEDLAVNFTDVDGKRGDIAYINPRPGMLLSDGRNLIKFADQLADIKLPKQEELSIASGSLVFADLVRIIKKEAPVLTLASFAGVLIFVFFTLKRSKPSLVIIFSLIWSAFMMLGIAAVLGLKINFFNFIVLPLTFGVGADYGINVALRLRNKRQSVATALRNTGGAVVLCSATTIIGYYVLTRATNQALASFGKGAVIGEFCCLIAAIVLVPAFLSLGRRK